MIVFDSKILTLSIYQSQFTVTTTMSCSKHGRVSFFTLEETLKHVKQNRQHKKRTLDHLLDEGQIDVNPKSNNFTYDLIDKEKAFLMLNFNKRIKKIDIFRTMLTDDLIEIIMERINDKMKFGNKTRMKKGLKKIFKFLAVYIQVQALQEKLIETEKKVDPQRKSFQAAINFFHEKFEKKPPGINFIEKLKTHFHISVKEETLLQKNFLVAIISLGQWVGWLEMRNYFDFGGILDGFEYVSTSLIILEFRFTS